jgi:hypothetical protein
LELAAERVGALALAGSGAASSAAGFRSYTSMAVPCRSAGGWCQVAGRGRAGRKGMGRSGIGRERRDGGRVRQQREKEREKELPEVCFQFDTLSLHWPTRCLTHLNHSTISLQDFKQLSCFLGKQATRLRKCVTVNDWG